MRVWMRLENGWGMRILISGGGTGGHIYPALAVARELQARYDADILYLGDANGLETKIVPAAGLPMVTITAGKLRRYLSLQTLTDIGRIPVGMMQAVRHVQNFHPDAAFTSGGYVSVPAGLAARIEGVPLVMHQQDVPANLANRLLTPFATRISVSFPDSLRHFPRRHMIAGALRFDIEAAQAEQLRLVAARHRAEGALRARAVAAHLRGLRLEQQRKRLAR